jgi:hypothetical protein
VILTSKIREDHNGREATELQSEVRQFVELVIPKELDILFASMPANFGDCHSRLLGHVSWAIASKEQNVWRAGNKLAERIQQNIGELEGLLLSEEKWTDSPQ